MKADSCCYANAIANVLWFLSKQADRKDQNVYKVNGVKVTLALGRRENTNEK